MSHTEPAARTTTRRISRRTIVKGAAWSVPVIAAAVAVPASTASTVTPPEGYVPIVIELGACGVGIPLFYQRNIKGVPVTYGGSVGLPIILGPGLVWGDGTTGVKASGPYSFEGSGGLAGLRAAYQSKRAAGFMPPVGEMIMNTGGAGTFTIYAPIGVQPNKEVKLADSPAIETVDVPNPYCTA